ncbi:MAG: nucleotide sugar dehydrogenase [Verrucomicrobia bacterium]|nr:nucleotide sugar dehydrogenase [Verrucomicrobiota bacterium]
MRIAVVGLGYVGCVAAAKLCEAGHEVLGVDINPAKVEAVAAGEPSVVEPGLDALFRAAAASGRLTATTDMAAAVPQADVLYLCVGTPPLASGELDMTAVLKVADAIAAAIPADNRSRVLLVRSTVKPGTAQELKSRLPTTVSVVVNPEFLREGSALDDWDHPELVVIGADDDHGRDIAEQLHHGIEAQIFHVAIATAELIKYLNNSWHALKVSFGNEVGRLCAGLGVDHGELMDVFLADHKLNISGRYLRPGMPYGGSCLPKDLGALRATGRPLGVQTPLLDAVAPSNEAHYATILSVIDACQTSRVGLVGLAFKQGTDDLRHSPGLRLLRELLLRGLDPHIFDPAVDPDRLLGQNLAETADVIDAIRDRRVDSLETLAACSDVIIFTHRPGPDGAALRRQHPAKIFLNAFEFRLTD